MMVSVWWLPRFFSCSDHDRNSRGNRPNHKHSIIRIALHCIWGSGSGGGCDGNDDRAAGKWPNKITFIIRSFNITKTTSFDICFTITLCYKFVIQVCVSYAYAHTHTHDSYFPFSFASLIRQIENIVYGFLKFNVYA